MTIHALPASSGTKALGEREEAPNILTLAVENMRCGGCIRSVERAAMSVAGRQKRAREPCGEAGERRRGDRPGERG